MKIVEDHSFLGDTKMSSLAGRSPLRTAVSAALAPRRALHRLTAAAELAAYARAVSSQLPPSLDVVREQTAVELDDAFMMVEPEQAQLLACLVHATSARQVLEIGTFTGYGTLAMARALPPDGCLITCELDRRSARIAQQHFDKSPLGKMIQLEVGPALETVRRLAGPFDLVLIDADKAGYLDYFEAVLPKVSDHGLIVADNTLHLGLTTGQESGSPAVRAIEAFNAAIAADDRVEQVILPLWDGMTIIRRVGADRSAISS
jgi:caffeoyl-CoA O-methyltransferase